MGQGGLMAKIPSTDGDHDLLVRLDENVKEILRRMSLADNEIINLKGRVTALENFRFYLLGGATLLGLVAGYVSQYLRNINR